MQTVLSSLSRAAKVNVAIHLRCACVTSQLGVFETWGTSCHSQVQPINVYLLSLQHAGWSLFKNVA